MAEIARRFSFIPFFLFFRSRDYEREIWWWEKYLTYNIFPLSPARRFIIVQFPELRARKRKGPAEMYEVEAGASGYNSGTVEGVMGECFCGKCGSS